MKELYVVKARVTHGEYYNRYEIVGYTLNKETAERIAKEKIAQIKNIEYWWMGYERNADGEYGRTEEWQPIVEIEYLGTIISD